MKAKQLMFYQLCNFSTLQQSIFSGSGGILLWW